MGKGTLTIYSASAGSGKTYKLTGIYLATLFNSRFNYRKILAVTFTNKATAEMKSRILDNLHKLAAGENSDYLPGLIKSTNKNEEWIRNEAKEILNSILHDFSRFSVSTIDSFFQKVLRAFAREVGLHSGFNIELDHSKILSEAVDEMIASSESDPQLIHWLKTYTFYNIEEEKSWNLKESIIKLSEELFKESFKILSADDRSNLENKEFLLNYIKKIKSLETDFKTTLMDYGKRAEEIFTKYALSDDMFYRKGQGVPGFIKSLTSGTLNKPNNYVLEILKDPPRWSTGSVDTLLQSAISNGLETVLKESIQYYSNNVIYYKTAEAVLSDIYALGILSDVSKNIHQITTSENIFLLSEAGEVLNLITGEDQSPFIYEKVGNRYEYYMIDEFQDTSIIQWKNFRPLIANSMAEGSDNLVVGDVKQSIYRWRNSDWKILGMELADMVDNDRIISEPLTTNWRSCSNIIKFNNSLFTVIPGLIDGIFENETLQVPFKKLYAEAIQTDPGITKGGYVRLEFLENDSERKWKDIVLERLPGVIESFQDKGYNASDIGIIVRDGREGALVLKRIIDYSNNCTDLERQKYNFNVVSNDSLLLSNSPVINFIIAVISVVNDPEDMISRALMLRFFLLTVGRKEADKVSLLSESLIAVSLEYFPEGYEDFLERIGQMSLFEATENIIKFFGLGDYSYNIAYLNTFQDYVVAFTGSKNSDIRSFLDWWETTGIKKSVILPGIQNAMQILTIHKSKGLEFKVVILPFIDWDLDHMPPKQPVLWVKPDSPPFNELRIVPVRYGSELTETIFRKDYKEEKYSVYIDNINLLYVAFTRAKDAIYGFSNNNPKQKKIAGILKSAVSCCNGISEGSGFSFDSYYNNENHVFEFGQIPGHIKDRIEDSGLFPEKYSVSQEMESLKLKLHGENYFSTEKSEVRKKINYGKLMHEVFEGIDVPADIPSVVRKLVLEGKLPAEDYQGIEEKVNSLINSPKVIDWFMPGIEVLKEAAILLPTGNLRRPDRVIFKDGKTSIIDFKFGEENPHYIEQVNQYRSLLVDMGYKNIDTYIWYVDKNKIVSA